MKKLKDHIDLGRIGAFEIITAMDFRKSPGEVFDSVLLGKTFLVTKQGKAIAVIQRPPGETLSIEVKSDGSWHYKSPSQGGASPAQDCSHQWLDDYVAPPTHQSCSWCGARREIAREQNKKDC